MKTVKKLIIGLIVIVIYVGSVFWGGQVIATESSVTGKIEYSLPYPGILPDSPVYFLKVARDQTMLWLARTPQQRAFYLLLLADKRLAAGEILISNHSNISDHSNGKTIGIMSIAKGEEYFGQAVDEAIMAKKSGGDTNDLFAKLMVSSAKHAEVIRELSGKIPTDSSGLMLKSYRNNQNSSERVREIFFQAMGISK